MGQPACGCCVKSTHVALGPQGVQVAALIERCATLTEDIRLGAAWAWAPLGRTPGTRSPMGIAWGATGRHRGTTWGAVCALFA